MSNPPINGQPALSSRGRGRRTRILKVAAALFSEHGYDSVSVNDIGHAAGVTGPAIYRYFPSKEALLASIFEHLTQRSREGIAAALDGQGSNREVLEELIDQQVALAIEEAEKIRIFMAEGRNLAPEAAERYAGETRRLLGVWTDLLGEVRPDLTREELHATVHALLALINSISLKREIDTVSARARSRLQAMAHAVVFGERRLAVVGGLES